MHLPNNSWLYLYIKETGGFTNYSSFRIHAEKLQGEKKRFKGEVRLGYSNQSASNSASSMGCSRNGGRSSPGKQKAVRQGFLQSPRLHITHGLCLTHNHLDREARALPDEAGVPCLATMTFCLSSSARVTGQIKSLPSYDTLLKGETDQPEI